MLLNRDANLPLKQKVIPLNTPTEIELAPGRTMQVTLLDVGIPNRLIRSSMVDLLQANHCIGAVMFLIVNAEKAVLYTGDVRCECSGSIPVY